MNGRSYCELGHRGSGTYRQFDEYLVSLLTYRSHVIEDLVIDIFADGRVLARAIWSGSTVGLHQVM